MAWGERTRRPRRPGTYVWEGHPRGVEYRLENDGMGMCNTGSGLPHNCVLGGIGCDVDHVAIARANLREAAAAARARRAA